MCRQMQAAATPSCWEPPNPTACPWIFQLQRGALGGRAASGTERTAARTVLVSAPYALKASDAETLGGAVAMPTLPVEPSMIPEFSRIVLVFHFVKLA